MGINSTNVTFEEPLKFRMSSNLIDEFAACELGLKEDVEGERTEHEGPLTYDILQRWSTRVELRDTDELVELWWALCSGTFQHHHPKAAGTLAAKIYPHMVEWSDRRPDVKRVFDLWSWPYEVPSDPPEIQDGEAGDE